MSRIDLFKNAISEKRAVKIIAGIDNFDLDRVKNVVLAATQAKASAIDISAKPEIIEMARSLTDLPLIASSIVPEELAKAIELGADGIELGNFDAMYRNGLRISASEVLELTRKTLSLINKSETLFCVTIPGHLSISEQISLAQSLESLGIDLIQTEGSATMEAKSEGARGLLEAAEVSIANTIELSRNVSLPIMTASGITSTTAAMAFAAGASAIGVGSAINKLNSSLAMVAAATSIVEIASNVSSKEVVLSK